ISCFASNIKIRDFNYLINFFHSRTLITNITLLIKVFFLGDLLYLDFETRALDGGLFIISLSSTTSDAMWSRLVNLIIDERVLANLVIRDRVLVISSVAREVLVKREVLIILLVTTRVLFAVLLLFFVSI